MMDVRAALTDVITRLDRVTQYPEALVIESQRHEVLDPRFRGDDRSLRSDALRDTCSINRSFPVLKSFNRKCL